MLDFGRVGPLRLLECLPEFCEELCSLATEAGHAGIAEQMGTLLIFDRCRCGDDFCGTFYTAAKPAGHYGPGHRNVELPAKKGTIILDLVDNRIKCVEVLDRDEIRLKLRTLFP